MGYGMAIARTARRRPRDLNELPPKWRPAMPAILLIVLIVLGALACTVVLGEWLVRLPRNRDYEEREDHWPIV